MLIVNVTENQKRIKKNSIPLAGPIDVVMPFLTSLLSFSPDCVHRT